MNIHKDMTLAEIRKAKFPMIRLKGARDVVEQNYQSCIDREQQTGRPARNTNAWGRVLGRFEKVIEEMESGE